MPAQHAKQAQLTASAQSKQPLPAAAAKSGAQASSGASLLPALQPEQEPQVSSFLLPVIYSLLALIGVAMQALTDNVWTISLTLCRVPLQKCSQVIVASASGSALQVFGWSSCRLIKPEAAAPQGHFSSAGRCPWPV